MRLDPFLVSEIISLCASCRFIIVHPCCVTCYVTETFQVDWFVGSAFVERMHLLRWRAYTPERNTPSLGCWKWLILSAITRVVFTDTLIHRYSTHLEWNMKKRVYFPQILHICGGYTAYMQSCIVNVWLLKIILHANQERSTFIPIYRY